MSVDARSCAVPTLWMSRSAIVFDRASILYGFGWLGWTCLTWLRDGSWHPPSLADLRGHVPLGGDRASPGWEDMRGLHYLLFRILHWCGRFPISLVPVAVGFAMAWTRNAAHDRAGEEPARRTRRFGSRRGL